MKSSASGSHLFYSGIQNNVPVNLWGFNVGLTDNNAIEDQLSGKRSLRIEAAAKVLAAARINIEDVKRIELTQVRQAYVAAVLARLNGEAAEESFQTFDRQLELTQKRFDLGAIDGLDFSRVKQGRQVTRKNPRAPRNARARMTIRARVVMRSFH